MGTPYFGVPVLESLSESSHSVVAVYTRPDRPAGRGRHSAPSLVKQAALARGIPVVEPPTLRDEAVVRELQKWAPDLVVVAAFAYLLPPEVLSVPPHGCLNVHPSLLPRYRGPSPVATALLNGDSQAGVTIMLMDSGLDTGPIVSQVAVPIGEEDTTDSLTSLLAECGARLLLDTINPWLAGRVTPRPQREDEATFSVRISAHDGKLDWALSATVLARQVRAYHPWPGSYTLWKGQRLKVVGARPISLRLSHPPGSVVAMQSPDTVGVATPDGTLCLDRVQLEGKRAVAADEFIRGHRDFVGSVLDT
jgi:methionyl-tRNA formyltransferase